LKKKQCPIEQESKRDALAELLALTAAELIEVYFGDESGFWQNPVIARASQFAGEEIRLLPEKGKRLAVFGLLNQNCEGKFLASEKTIDSEFVIDCLEEWLTEKNEKPRVLVLECQNSSVEKDAGEISRVGRKRILYFQSAAVFTAFEYY